MTVLKSRLVVFLFPLLLSLPFINRAYFVDDHFFVRIATWLEDHPTKPYDFASQDPAPSDNLRREQLLTTIVNPLLHHYYLALLLKMGGEREWFLRLGCVLLSCFSALFIFELARRWTHHALVATLMVLLTPAHWVSAHSLLIDPTMSLFFMGGLYFFVRSSETDSLLSAVLSGGFMGLALLTKYTAVLVLLITGFWWCLRFNDIRRRWMGPLAWSIAFAMILSFVLSTRSLYGQSHLSAASAVTLHWPHWGKIIVLFVFLSGGIIAPFFSWGFLSRKKSLLAGALTLILVFLFASSWGGLSPAQAIFLSLGFVSTFLLLGLFWEARRQWDMTSDLFLLLWASAFVAMMTVVMQWVAVRYLIIATPAFVFMAVRLVEIFYQKKANRILPLAAAGLFLISFSVAFADYQQAESSRFVVKELGSRGLNQGERRFYLGDSFTTAYVPRAGWSEMPVQGLRPGDRILVSEITMPLGWFLRRGIPVKHIAQMEVPSHFPVKVMDAKAGASFYASVWGPLPFCFSLGPWERFHVFEVIESVGNY